MSGEIPLCAELKIRVRKDDDVRTSLGFLALRKTKSRLGHTEYFLQISKTATPAKFKLVGFGQDRKPFIAPILTVEVNREPPCSDRSGYYQFFDGWLRTLEPILKTTSEYINGDFWTIFTAIDQRATTFNYSAEYFIYKDPQSIPRLLGRTTEESASYRIVEGRKVEPNELHYGFTLGSETVLLQFEAY